MATTTNYSWTTPDDTDLVKDGAAAIRTLGSSVDTTTKALNPSTTLGDIEYRSSTANTNTRLGIGTSGQVLSVVGGVPAWGDISAGGMTSIASGSLSGSSVVLGSIPATYNSLTLELRDWYNAGNGNSVFVRITGVTTNYDGVVARVQDLNPAVDWNGSSSFTTGTTSASENVDNNHYLICQFPNYADSASRKLCIANATYQTNGNVERATASTSYHNTATAIDSLTLSVEGGGNFSGGTYILWGVK
jgi:hypothetical protein